MDKFLKRKQTDLHETDESSSASESETNEISKADRTKHTHKLRKYDEDYVKYGFVESAASSDRPQCLICNKILSNEALKPAKLKRYLTTQHPDLADKPKIFFQRK
jgi:hypothetical protein